MHFVELKIYRNAYQMDNNGNTSSDMEATKPVLWYQCRALAYMVCNACEKVDNYGWPLV